MKQLTKEEDKLIKEIMESVNSCNKIQLMEQCDCGAMVRHNNGGNYHDILEVRRDEISHMYEYRYFDTCELKEKPDFEASSASDVTGFIRNAIQEGWNRWV